MKRLGAGGLPGDLLLCGIDAGNAKEAGAELTAGGWCALEERFERNLHLAVPDLRGCVHARLHLHAGVPRRPTTPRALGAIDVEVNPLTLRRNLKLFAP